MVSTLLIIHSLFEVMCILTCSPTNTSLKSPDAELMSRVLQCNIHFVCLVAAIKFNEVLRELFLADNKLTPSDGVQLGSLLKTNRTLSLLDLRNNLLQVTMPSFLIACDCFNLYCHLTGLLQTTQFLEDITCQHSSIWQYCTSTGSGYGNGSVRGLSADSPSPFKTKTCKYDNVYVVRVFVSPKW
jgi:hypothetical protein